MNEYDEALKMVAKQVSGEGYDAGSCVESVEIVDGKVRLSFDDENTGSFIFQVDLAPENAYKLAARLMSMGMKAEA